MKSGLSNGKVKSFKNNKRFSFLEKHNLLTNSCYSTLYLIDLFEFGPKFGLYHYAEFPSYKRVKWGRLTYILTNFFFLYKSAAKDCIMVSSGKVPFLREVVKIKSIKNHTNFFFNLWKNKKYIFMSTNPKKMGLTTTVVTLSSF